MEAKDRLHLIGSIPLDNSEQVFRRLCDELGPFLRCMPDGETGERSRWVYFQRQMLLDHPAMEIDPTVPPYKFIQWDGKVVREIEQLRFKPGVDPATVDVRDRLRQGRTRLLGSLQEAARRRRHPQARALPGLPADAAGQRLPLCQRRGPRDLFRRLRARAEDGARQHRRRRSRQPDLSIQWDVCQEVLAFENYFKDRPADYKKQTFDMLGRLGDAVPEGVEMGYHLCYGSPRDEHLVQPKDSAILVEMMNGIARRHPAAHRFSAHSRAQGPRRRRLLCADQGFRSGRPEPSSISACCTTTTMPATRSASTRRGAMPGISACRPSAAGAAPSPGACPDF